MVSKLPSHLTSAVSAAIEAAEKRTSAEVAVVIAKESDGYQPYLLLDGFALGCLIGTGLWWTKILTAFPLLVLLQALCMAGFALLPLFQHLGRRLIPPQVLHHHAALRAHAEFQVLSRNIAPEKPVALLYVSLAERYAHILHSRDIGAKIAPGIWQEIMSEFTAGVTKPGLRPACETAIARMADALAKPFPKRK